MKNPNNLNSFNIFVPSICKLVFLRELEDNFWNVSINEIAKAPSHIIFLIQYSIRFTIKYEREQNSRTLHAVIELSIIIRSINRTSLADETTLYE